MSRVIKYRGKRVDNGEWVEGDLIHGVGTKLGKLFILEVNQWARTRDIDGFEVDPETVGQLVYGHYDFDLYEGDIVDVSHEDDVFYDDDNQTVDPDDLRRCVVRWGGESYPAFELYQQIKTKCNSRGWFWDSIDDECNAFSNDSWLIRKVVGNIHDNPELIGGAE